MVKPFSDAVVGLKKGELSAAPVQTQFGWHVIKMVDSRATQVPAYDKVKDGLERTLQQRKLEKMMLGLKDKAKIEVAGAKNSRQIFLPIKKACSCRLFHDLIPFLIIMAMPTYGIIKNYYHLD